MCCSIMMHHCTLFPATSNTLSKQRIASLHLPKSHTEAITHVPQIINYAVLEKGMENKGELT